MKSKSLLANLVLCGALAVAVPVFAKPVSTTLPVTHTVKVGQTEIKAGDYRFLIDGNHLTILNGHKQVAEAEGRWEDRDSSRNSTASCPTPRVNWWNCAFRAKRAFSCSLSKDCL